MANSIAIFCVMRLRQEPQGLWHFLLASAEPDGSIILPFTFVFAHTSLALLLFSIRAQVVVA